MRYLRCGCGGYIDYSYEFIGMGKIIHFFDCDKCGFYVQFRNCTEAEAIASFQKATRCEATKTERKLSDSVCVCLDPECCGVLGNIYDDSTVKCNECGQIYLVVEDDK